MVDALQWVNATAARVKERKALSLCEDLTGFIAREPTSDAWEAWVGNCYQPGARL